jgi:hypothetical protein
VLPDVWLEFGLHPRASRDLLLTPHSIADTRTPPGKLAGIVSRRLHEDRTRATSSDRRGRRVPVAWGACWSASCSRQAASRIGAVLNWSDEQVASELESFEVERAAVMQRPKRSSLSLELAAD